MFLGKVAFSRMNDVTSGRCAQVNFRINDFTSGRCAQVNFHCEVTENNENVPSKTLCGPQMCT